MTKKLLFAHLFSLLFSAICFGQNVEVTGQVTEDGSNSPVARVTVTQKGTQNATTTNESGFFSIKVPIGSTLTFSSIGYGTKEVEVTGTTINTSLVNQSQDLNAVVVTALGIRKEKKALSYAVSEVKGDELTQARSTNIANQLQGKVAGLNISQTATGPGGSARIIIRGNGSISGNNQPLIVVDGIPMDNSNQGSAGMWGGSDKGDGISSLNPDEIESMSVLKGGTAAALYGSRASNGAILVTTKGGGKAGKGIGVEVNSNFVVEDLLISKYKDYQYEYGTGDNGLKPTSADPNGTQTNSFGGKLDGSQVIQFDGQSRPYVAHKDNLKKFYNAGNTFTNTVALSGATEKISYRFSMSNLDNKSIIPNSGLKRQNFSLNLNGQLSKRLSFLTNVKYIKERTKNRPRVSDSPGNANYTLATMPTSLSVDALKESKYLPNGFERVWSNNQYVQNPYYATEDFIQNDSKDRFIAAFEPRFNVTDWLYVKGRAGFDKFNYRNVEITPTGTGFNLGGGIGNNLRNFTETNLDLMIGVDKKLGSKFAVNGLIGGNNMKRVQKSEDYGGGPFNIPFFYDISNVNPGSRNSGYGYYEKRINSIYGSADISYENYLYLTLTGRNDWFSTLAKGRNSIFYPSVGVSFILSEAVNLPSSINYAKVRASWAQAGGDTEPYNLSLNYGLTGAHLNSPLAQISNGTVPNALLQPLLSTTMEAGIEGRLFNNKMNFDIAVYNRKTEDDIVSATISSTSGYGSALFNVGEITNTGVELLAGYKLSSSKKFSWDISLNMGYNKSKVVSLYQDQRYLQVDEPRSRSVYIFQEVGQAYSQIRGIPFKRDAAGNVIHDAQGFPIAGELKSFGSGVAPMQAGISNSFRFGNVGVSFLIDGKFGGFIYSGTNALAYRYGLHKETLPGRETGVVGAGVLEDGKPNNVNVPAQAYYSRLYNFAEPFVYSSDFVKLRQVIIDYNIPTKIFGKIPFKAASISIVGRNLLILYKKTPNIDPESTYNNSNAQGFEFVGMPPTRTVGVNLNLKF